MPARYGRRVIEHLLLRNFRVIREAQLRLDRLTVLVGGNGAGKTSALHALHLLSQLEAGVRLSEMPLLREGLEPLARIDGEERVREFELEARGKDANQRERTATFSAQKLEQGAGAAPRWAWSYRAHAAGQRPFEVSGDEDALATKAGSNGDRAGDGGVLLRLDPAQLALPSVEQGAPSNLRMNEAGAGLAAALSGMALNRPDDFAALQQDLRSVVPGVRRIRFDRVAVTASEVELVHVGADPQELRFRRTYPALRILLDTDQAEGVPADAISEGTLIVLGLLAVLRTNERRGLLLLDDVDRALHPLAQHRLLELLREFLERRPELQIVATTHSPYLLDKLKFEEVQVAALLDDGTASFAGFDEHPAYERWRQEMHPGEYWSIAGESWIREKRRGDPEKHEPAR